MHETGCNKFQASSFLLITQKKLHWQRFNHNSLPGVRTQRSSPYSQEPAAGPYPEPVTNINKIITVLMQH
jgi:hypothetical protein